MFITLYTLLKQLLICQEMPHRKLDLGGAVTFTNIQVMRKQAEV